MLTLHPRRLERLAPYVLLAVAAAACSPDQPTAVTSRVSTDARRTTSAASALVTSIADDGTPGTLRAVVLAAPSGTTITFDPSLAGATITLASSLDLYGDLTLQGPAPQGITIAGSPGEGYVLSVDLNASVTLQDVSITGGDMSGIANDGTLVLERVQLHDNSTLLDGGAIISKGFLTMRNSVIRNNRSARKGGGVWAVGYVSILNSTFDRNVASQDGGALWVDATAGFQMRQSVVKNNVAGQTSGGILLGASGTASIVNSTISSNAADAFPVGWFRAPTYIQASTIHDNQIKGPSGTGAVEGLAVYAPLTIEHSIITRNTTSIGGANCYNSGGSFITLKGANVIDDASCNGSGPAPITADPKLGPLADNGGPTFTHALLAGSSAIEAAPSCVVSVDQRGVARPAGAKCDIGAFEFQAFTTVALTIAPAGTVDRKTGVATVSGTITCSASESLMLRVTLRQPQKARSVPNIVTASADVPVTCGTSPQNWTAVVTPTSGAFVNSPVEVSVQTQAGAWVTPASASATSVSMSWQRP